MKDYEIVHHRVTCYFCDGTGRETIHEIGRSFICENCCDGVMTITNWIKKDED